MTTPKGGTPKVDTAVIRVTLDHQANLLSIPKGDTVIRVRPIYHTLNAILPMALIPAGLLTYMLYLWITFGNPLLFSAEEALAWQRHTSFPWVGILNAIQGIITQGPYYVGDTSDLLLT